MDFTPTPEQTAAREPAAEIFGDLSTPERLAGCGGGTDAELWKALCTAGLPGAVAETGLLGLVLMLEEQGRTTAQVPFAASCVYGLLAVGAHGGADSRQLAGYPGSGAEVLEELGQLLTSRESRASQAVRDAQQVARDVWDPQVARDPDDDGHGPEDDPDPHTRQEAVS